MDGEQDGRQTGRMLSQWLNLAVWALLVWLEIPSRSAAQKQGRLWDGHTAAGLSQTKALLSARCSVPL